MVYSGFRLAEPASSSAGAGCAPRWRVLQGARRVCGSGPPGL